MSAIKDPATGKFVAGTAPATPEVVPTPAVPEVVPTLATPEVVPASAGPQVGDVVRFTRVDPIFGTTYADRGVVQEIDNAGVHVRPLEAYAVLAATVEVA